MEGACPCSLTSATFVLNREKRVYFSGQQTRRCASFWLGVASRVA